MLGKESTDDKGRFTRGKCSGEFDLRFKYDLAENPVKNRETPTLLAFLLIDGVGAIGRGGLGG